jgi:hypothetical protein
MDEIETIMWVNLNHVNEIFVAMNEVKQYGRSDELDDLDDMG